MTTKLKFKYLALTLISACMVSSNAAPKPRVPALPLDRLQPNAGDPSPQSATSATSSGTEFFNIADDPVQASGKKQQPTDSSVMSTVLNTKFLLTAQHPEDSCPDLVYLPDDKERKSKLALVNPGANTPLATSSQKTDVFKYLAPLVSQISTLPVMEQGGTTSIYSFLFSTNREIVIVVRDAMQSDGKSQSYDLLPADSFGHLVMITSKLFAAQYDEASIKEYLYRSTGKISQSDLLHNMQSMKQVSDLGMYLLKQNPDAEDRMLHCLENPHSVKCLAEILHSVSYPLKMLMGNAVSDFPISYDSNTKSNRIRLLGDNIQNSLQGLENASQGGSTTPRSMTKRVVSGLKGAAVGTAYAPIRAARSASNVASSLGSTAMKSPRMAANAVSAAAGAVVTTPRTMARMAQAAGGAVVTTPRTMARMAQAAGGAMMRALTPRGRQKQEAIQAPKAQPRHPEQSPTEGNGSETSWVTHQTTGGSSPYDTGETY